MSTQTSLTSVFAHLARSLMTSSKDVSVTESSKDRAEHRHHLHALNAHPTKLLARLTQQSASAQLVKSTMLPEEDASVMAVTKDSQRDQTQEAIHSLAKNVQQDKHSAELIQHNVSAHQVKRMTVLYKHAFAQRVNPMMYTKNNAYVHHHRSRTLVTLTDVTAQLVLKKIQMMPQNACH